MEEILKGKSIYKSFSNRKIFDGYVIQSIKVGEESGNIDEVFYNIHKNLESKIKTRRSILQAMAYPIVVLIICYILFNIIFIIIVPELSSTITVSKSDISTLVRFSLWFKRNYIIINSMVFIIGVLIVKLYEKIKANNDNFTIKIPIFGELILSNLRIGIYESLFLLINNGVPITTAIENIIYDCKSKFIKEVLNKVLIDIRNGNDLTVALNKKYIFDDISMVLITTGIESGYLPETIEKVTEMEKEKFNIKLNKVVKKIGPVMLIIMGGVVLSIVISVMETMFSYMEGIM
ncbi:type II secretion system F family protein [Clostridium bornimense]|nr:type II secretion system F family protein [Clostridium bornimense]